MEIGQVLCNPKVILHEEISCTVLRLLSFAAGSWTCFKACPDGDTTETKQCSTPNLAWVLLHSVLRLRPFI